MEKLLKGKTSLIDYPSSFFLFSKKCILWKSFVKPIPIDFSTPNKVIGNPLGFLSHFIVSNMFVSSLRNDQSVRSDEISIEVKNVQNYVEWIKGSKIYSVFSRGLWSVGWVCFLIAYTEKLLLDFWFFSFYFLYKAHNWI